MKRWAILTVALYAAALLLLTTPVILLAFGAWPKNAGLQFSNNTKTFYEALQTYSSALYWFLMGIPVAGQAILLLIPIRIADLRMPSRRPLRTPAVVSGFFMATLLIAGLLSLGCAIWGDRVFETGKSPAQLTGLVAIYFVSFWGLWAVLFQRHAHTDDPAAMIQRATGWLLNGSILELLIAIPSHILARRHADWRAPVGTFWGIATGISVMLLCFGPGVYTLFAERFKRLQLNGVRT